MIVGIAGCGGIGSNVAYALAREAFVHHDISLKFGDFDKIEKSNLNRQFYFYDQIGEYKAKCLVKNLKMVNPELKTEGEVIRFDRENIAEFFDDCDIIIEGFDKKSAKAMLVEELMGKKPIISASGIGGSDLSDVKIRRVNSHLTIVGDFKTDIERHETYASKVIFISTMMANLAMEKGGFYEKKS